MFDQHEYNIRCEWGENGASLLAPISDVIIVVDVLSFSTSVDVATSQGAIVFPYRSKDPSVYDFAASVSAQVADKNNKRGYRLSPSTLRSLAPEVRIVLPSPNGSAISLLAGSTPALALAGCLRNCRAVAEYAMNKGTNIAVIPAGERWDDGTLRPCFEDMVGAGSIIQYLRGRSSPEAEAAAAAFQRAYSGLLERIQSCGSGKEKIGRGESEDLVLAADLNKSDCVPLLGNGYFSKVSP